MDKEISLEKYLVELRRIREHRTKGAEKEIRVIYKALLRDLQAHIGKYYSKYGEDDKLSYEILYRKGKYARFLEEVEHKLNDISPKTKKVIRKTVEETYKSSYEGMVKAVTESADNRELQEAAQKLGSLDGDTVKQVVNNPISGLTLKDTLEKNRKDIIYDVKRNIGVGLMNGDRYSTMSRRIAESLDGDYKKAVRIVRTETKRTGEGGTYDFYARIDKKLQDAETGQRIQKTWHTAQDQKVRPGRGISKKPSGKANHQRMEGKKLLIDEKFDLGRGVKTLCPGNSGDASNDINCRCWLSYSFIMVENPVENDTMEAQEVNIKPRPVTEKAIQNVPNIHSQGLTKEQNVKLQTAHKDLLRFIKGVGLGIEAMAVYDMAMNQLSRVKGADVGKVKGKSPDTPQIVIHNHPSGETFTMEDLLLFLKHPNIKILTAVDNATGKVFVIEKLDDYNISGVVHYINEQQAAFPDWESDPEKYVAFMEKVLKGAEQYGIRYYVR